MDRILCLLIYMISAFSGSAKILPGPYEKWEPGKRLKILLVGYNGARNTGSDVRVAAIAKQVKALFGEEQVQITVMTLDAGTLQGYFDEDVELYSFSSLFPFSLYHACSTHHAAILCEGSTLKSTFANALTLFLCEASGVMAGQGKSCIAYGSEVGTMEPFLERAARRLCRDTYFITRTQESLAALRRLGLHGHAGTDAAWSYDGAVPAQEAEALLRKQGWDGKKPLLGIAVINPFCWPVRASVYKWLRGLAVGNLAGQYDKWYFFSDSPGRREACRRYIRGFAAGTRAFLKKQEYFPVLIGMEKLDAEACRALQARLSCPGAVFLSGDWSADIMTGVLHRLSLLVTSRYHAAVLSMEGACPIVAVSMDERLDGIMRELGYDRDYLLHVTDEDLGRKIYRALMAAHADREAIHRHILAQRAHYLEMLEEMGAFLKRYLQEGLQLQSF